MNIWMEWMALLCGLALLSLVGAIRIRLLALGVEPVASTAPDRRPYSLESK